MPPIDLIQTLIGGGAATVLAFAVWAFYTGRVRVGSLVDRDHMSENDRFLKVEKERDDWKNLAQAQTPELKRLNDLLETVVEIVLEVRPPTTGGRSRR